MDEFLKLLSNLGLDIKGKEQSIKDLLQSTIDSAADNKVNEAVKKAEAEAKAKYEKQDPKPGDDDDDKKDVTILALKKQIEDFTELVGEMKKDRDASVSAQKEKLEKDKTKKVEELKKKGLDEGKITEANWTEKYKKIAEIDPESFETILSDLAVDPHFKKSETNSNDDTGGGSYIGPLRGADKTILESMSEMEK